MSFALTSEQYENGTKDVTRRLGWANLKAGDVFMGVEKAQGLKKGQHPRQLGPSVIVNERWEPLRRLIDDLDYGFSETTREGFPEGHRNHWPSQFISFFCNTHKGCTPGTEVHRIEFKRLEEVSSKEPEAK